MASNDNIVSKLTVDVVTNAEQAAQKLQDLKSATQSVLSTLSEFPAKAKAAASAIESDFKNINESVKSSIKDLDSFTKTLQNLGTESQKSADAIESSLSSISFDATATEGLQSFLNVLRDIKSASSGIRLQPLSKGIVSITQAAEKINKIKLDGLTEKASTMEQAFGKLLGMAAKVNDKDFLNLRQVVLGKIDSRAFINSLVETKKEAEHILEKIASDFIHLKNIPISFTLGEITFPKTDTAGFKNALSGFRSEVEKAFSDKEGSYQIQLPGLGFTRFNQDLKGLETSTKVQIESFKRNLNKSLNEIPLDSSTFEKFSRGIIQSTEKAVQASANIVSVVRNFAKLKEVELDIKLPTGKQFSGRLLAIQQAIEEEIYKLQNSLTRTRTLELKFRDLRVDFDRVSFQDVDAKIRERLKPETKSQKVTLSDLTVVVDGSTKFFVSPALYELVDSNLRKSIKAVNVLAEQVNVALGEGSVNTAVLVKELKAKLKETPLNATLDISAPVKVTPTNLKDGSFVASITKALTSSVAKTTIKDLYLKRVDVGVKAQAVNISGVEKAIQDKIAASSGSLEITAPTTFSASDVFTQASAFKELSAALNGIASKLNTISDAELRLTETMADKNVALERQIALFRELSSLTNVSGILNQTKKAIQASLDSVQIDLTKATVTISAESKKKIETEFNKALKGIKTDLSKIQSIVEVNASISTTIKMLEKQAGLFAKIQNTANGMKASLDSLAASENTLTSVLERETLTLADNSSALSNIEKLAKATQEVVKAYSSLFKASAGKEIQPVDISGVLSSVEGLTNSYTGIVNASAQIRDSQTQVVALAKEATKALEQEQSLLKNIAETAANAAKVTEFKKATSVKLVNEADVEKDIRSIRNFTTSIDSAKQALKSLADQKVSAFGTQFKIAETNATSLKEALIQVTKAKSNLTKVITSETESGIKPSSINAYNTLLDKIKEYTALVIRSNEATAESSALIANQQNLLGFQKGLISNILADVSKEDAKYKIIDKDLTSILEKHQQVLSLETKEFKNESDIATALKERAQLLTALRQQAQVIVSKQGLLDVNSDSVAKLREALRLIGDIESLMMASAAATSLFEKDINQSAKQVGDLQAKIKDAKVTFDELAARSGKAIKAPNTDEFVRVNRDISNMQLKVESLISQLLELSRIPGFNIPIQGELAALEQMATGSKQISESLANAAEAEAVFTQKQKALIESSKQVSIELAQVKKNLDANFASLRKVAESKVDFGGKSFLINPKVTLNVTEFENGIKILDAQIKALMERASGISKSIALDGIASPEALANLQSILAEIKGLTEQSSLLKTEFKSLSETATLVLPSSLSSQASKTSSSVNHLSESVSKLTQALNQLGSENVSYDLLNKLRESTRQATSSISNNIASLLASFGTLEGTLNSIQGVADKNPIQLKILDSNEITTSLTTLKTELSALQEQLGQMGQSSEVVNTIISSIERLGNASLTSEQRVAGLNELMAVLRTRSTELSSVLDTVNSRVAGMQLQQAFRELPGNLAVVQSNLQGIVRQTDQLSGRSIELAKAGTHLELQQLLTYLKDLSRESNAVQRDVDKLAQSFFKLSLMEGGKNTLLTTLQENGGALKNALEQVLQVKIDTSNGEAAYKSLAQGFGDLKARLQDQGIRLKVNTDEATRALKSTSSFARAIEEATGLRATMRSITEEGSLLSRAVGKYFETIASSLNLSKKSTDDYVIGLRELEDELIRLRSGVVTWSMGVMMLGQMISAPIIKAISDFTTFGDTMGMVQGVAGATNDVMQKLVSTSLAFTSVTRFFPQQASEGLLELTRAGFSANDALSALPTVLRMAQAASFGVGESASITTHLMHTFGMSIGEVSTATDVLVKAANSSTATVSDLGYSFTYVGAVARGLGVSLQETIGAIATLHNAGFRGSMAGTALRGMLDSLFNPTKDEAELLAELSDRIGGVGLQIKNAQGDFVGFVSIIEQLEKAGLKSDEALRLFGQRAGPGAAAMLRLGSEKLRQMNVDLETAGGTAAGMSQVMQNTLKGSFLLFASSVQGLMHDIAKNLEAPLKAVTDFATGFVLAVKNVHEALGPLAAVIDTVAAAIAGFLAVMGSMTFTWFLVIVPFVQFVGLINTFVKVAKAGTDQLYSMSKGAKDAANAVEQLNNAQRASIIGKTTGVKPGDNAAVAKSIGSDQIRQANVELAKQLQLLTGNKEKLSQFSAEAISTYLQLDEGSKKYLASLEQVQIALKSMQVIKGLQNIIPPGTEITVEKLDAAISAIKSKLNATDVKDSISNILERDLGLLTQLKNSMSSLSSESKAKLELLNLELLLTSNEFSGISNKAKEFVNVLRTVSPAVFQILTEEITLGTTEVSSLSARLKQLGLEAVEVQKLTNAFKSMQAATAEEKAELQALVGQLSKVHTQGSVAGKFASSGTTVVGGAMDFANVLNGLNSMRGVAPIVSAEVMHVASSAGFLLFTFLQLGSAVKDITGIIGTVLIVAINRLGTAFLALAANIKTSGLAGLALSIKDIAKQITVFFSGIGKAATSAIGWLKGLQITAAGVTAGLGILAVAAGLVYFAYKKFTEVERTRDELVKLQEESEVLKKYVNDVKAAENAVKGFISSIKTKEALKLEGIDINLGLTKDGENKLKSDIVSRFQRIEEDFKIAKDSFESSNLGDLKLEYKYNPDLSLFDVTMNKVDEKGKELKIHLIKAGTPDAEGLAKAIEESNKSLQRALVGSFESQITKIGILYEDLLKGENLDAATSEHNAKLQSFVDTNSTLLKNYVDSVADAAGGLENVNLEEVINRYVKLLEGSNLSRYWNAYWNDGGVPGILRMNDHISNTRLIMDSLKNSVIDAAKESADLSSQLNKIKDLRTNFEDVKAGASSFEASLAKLKKSTDGLKDSFGKNLKEMFDSLDKMASSRTDVSKYVSDEEVKNIDRTKDADLAALSLRKDAAGVYEAAVSKIVLDNAIKRTAVITKGVQEELAVRRSAMQQVLQALGNVQGEEVDKNKIDIINKFIAAAKNQASAYQTSIEAMIAQTKKLNEAINTVKQNSIDFAEKIQDSINTATKSPFDFNKLGEIGQAELDAKKKVNAAKEAIDKGEYEKAVKLAEEAHSKLKSVETKVGDSFNAGLKDKFKKSLLEIGGLHEQASNAIVDTLDSSKMSLQTSIDTMSSNLERLVKEIVSALERIQGISQTGLKNATYENGVLTMSKDMLERSAAIDKASESLKKFEDLKNQIGTAPLDSLHAFDFFKNISVDKDVLLSNFRELFNAVDGESETAFNSATENLTNFVATSEQKLKNLKEQLALKIGLEPDPAKKQALQNSFDEVSKFLDIVTNYKDSPLKYNEEDASKLKQDIRFIESSLGSLKFSDANALSADLIRSSLSQVKDSLKSIDVQNLIKAQVSVKELMSDSSRLALSADYKKDLGSVNQVLQSLVGKITLAKESASKLELPPASKTVEPFKQGVDQVVQSVKKVPEVLDKVAVSTENASKAVGAVETSVKKTSTQFESLSGKTLTFSEMLSSLKEGVKIPDFENYKKSFDYIDKDAVALYEKLAAMKLPEDFLGFTHGATSIKLTFEDLWNNINKSVDEINANANIDLNFLGERSFVKYQRMIGDINEAFRQLTLVEADVKNKFKTGILDEEGFNASMAKISDLKASYISTLDSIKYEAKNSFDDAGFIFSKDQIVSINSAIDVLKTNVQDVGNSFSTIPVEGFTRANEEAKKLADETTKPKELSVEGSQALSTIANVATSMNALENKQVEVGVIDRATDQINSIANSLRNLKDMQISISANTARAQTGGLIGDIVQRFAVGGQALSFNRPGYSVVPGAGSGDTVPAMLEPGEFIIRRDTVRKLGTNFLYALNSGMLQFRQLGGMISSVGSNFRTSLNFDPSVVTGFNSGGLAQVVTAAPSSGSRDTVDVRLQVGDNPKKFSVQSDRETANELLRVLKNL